ncbi:hypothetical protein HELRODRAFT_145767, partial [Helobdella robusta]|uniref:Receptor ligand binding region domain-containing protein n=1 Tax=Helobdella robusta TaxID=6412 RepID=T1EJM8_HELRO
IALLLPYTNKYLFSFFKVKPAVDIALSKIYSYLPSNINITLLHGDSQCSETEAPLEAFRLYYDKENRPTLFLGPNCPYAVAPVTRVVSSSSWQLPIISTAAFMKNLDSKTMYSSLTRMHGTYSKLGSAVAKIYHYFNWTISGMIL